MDVSIGAVNNFLPGLTTRGVISPVLEAAQAQGISPNASIFGDMLQQAIAGAVQADAEHKATTAGLVLGEDVDLHTIPIASQKAELMLNLTVQMRNKMVEAYQEIARMQI